MNTLVESLRRAWDEGEREANPSLTSGPPIPLARSGQDQVTTTDNPLWEIVRWLPASTYFSWQEDLRPAIYPSAWTKPLCDKLIAAGATREHLASTYSWSIPTPGDLWWLKATLDGRAVVEVGAGSGYWAWQLEQIGVEVAAYDPNPVGDNPWCTGGPYTTVLADDASAAKHHPDRALMLIWPPYDDSAGAHALASYKGDMLIFAGEGEGGCTADDAYFELLSGEWEELASSPRHVTWWGINCSLTAYQRR